MGIDSAAEIARSHGWSVQTIDHNDATGALFLRGDEQMTSEWVIGGMSWADYVSPSDPEGVFTEHENVLVELLSSAPNYMEV